MTYSTWRTASTNHESYQRRGRCMFPATDQPGRLPAGSSTRLDGARDLSQPPATSGFRRFTITRWGALGYCWLLLGLWSGDQMVARRQNRVLESSKILELTRARAYGQSALLAALVCTQRY